MSENRTEMKPHELKCARESLGYSQSDAARVLNTPRRTYISWENGETRIPGIVPVTMRLLAEKDKWFMSGVEARTLAKIGRDYPAGIPSEIPEEDR